LDLGAKTGQMITPDKAMGLTWSKHVKTPEIAKTWQEAGWTPTPILFGANVVNVTDNDAKCRISDLKLSSEWIEGHLWNSNVA
jgi:hypothetical protein